MRHLPDCHDLAAFSPQFHPDHLADLAKSGLSAGTIRALGICTVPAGEIPEHLDSHNPGVESTLCFPYPELDGFCRDKVFPAIKDKNGHTIRYLQRKGSGVHLYIPPSAQVVLSDPATPLYFTEGEKKAAKAGQEGYPTVGLGGLWNWLWKGQPIGELDWITWTDRPVFLVPDSDVWQRQDLLHAVYAFGTELEKRGACVRVIKLSANSEGKTGLDDFLVAQGKTALGAQEHFSISSSVFNEAKVREERRKRRLEIKEEEEEEEEKPEESEAPLVFPDIAWRGAFRTYLDAVGSTTSAPDAYHFAAFAAAAGCCLGRRAYMYYGRRKRVYPNGYYLLIGPTGDHKGTAGEGAPDLLSPYDKDNLAVLDGVGSAEGLCDWLAGKDREEIGLPGADTHLLYLDEFGALATIGGWTASTLYYHLCRLFECPDSYDIRFRKNPVHLDKPTLSILGGTTPSWFWRSVGEVDIMGGIGNRFAYFSGPQKPSIARPPQPDTAKMQEVQAALNRLRSIQPQQASFTPEAAAVWDQFFARWEESRPREELAAAITKRIDLYVLKTAMQYAALEGTLPNITEEQITAAIAVGHYCFRCALRLVDAHQQTSQQGRCEQAIVSFLTGKTKWVPRRTLQRHCARFDSWIFRKALESLVWVGRVREDDGARKNQKVYRLA